MALFCDPQMEILAESSLFIRENMQTLTSECKEHFTASYYRLLSSPVLQQLRIMRPVQPLVKHKINIQNITIMF